jgi:hypothetical protein
MMPSESGVIARCGSPIELCLDIFITRSPIAIGTAASPTPQSSMNSGRFRRREGRLLPGTAALLYAGSAYLPAPFQPAPLQTGRGSADISKEKLAALPGLIQFMARIANTEIRPLMPLPRWSSLFRRAVVIHSNDRVSSSERTSLTDFVHESQPV